MRHNNRLITVKTSLALTLAASLLFSMSSVALADQALEVEESSISYEVSPAEGEVVDFHTAAQEAFLSNPYIDGVIATPASIEIDGETYLIDGNPYDSKDLETRKRLHPDYSIPDPVVLTWEGEPASDTYYVEISPDANFEQDVRTFTADGNTVDVYNLLIGTQYFWRVAPTEDEIGDSDIYSFSTSSVGPRNLYIDGVTNVRDLGGFELADGSGIVRQGLVYRSGRLNLSNIDDDVSIFEADPDYFELTITEKGIDTLVNELGVKTEVDIRIRDQGTYVSKEIGNMNNDRIEGLEYVSLPMDFVGGTETDNNFTRLDNPASIKAFFELLADEANYPVIFHCNIGTDRTGCLGYLLGALLGMSEEDLYVNYVFSNFGSIAGSTRASGRASTSIYEGTGYGVTVMSYPGETLSEQAENALIDICGLSKETLDKVREILIEKY